MQSSHDREFFAHFTFRGTALFPLLPLFLSILISLKMSMNGNTKNSDDHLRESLSTNTSTDSLKLSPSFQELRHAIPLIPVVKDYAWGIRGMDSRVGRYAMQSGSIDEINPDVPYAELWIGTHPSGPATLQDGRSLQQAVGGELPFLFKILSAGKALSIQAHPDKTIAEQLHSNDPTHYKDANHKPEMV